MENVVADSPGGSWPLTHRLVPPAETLARVKRFMPVMGITRIANVTGLDSIGIPVVMVCRPNSRSVSVSQGKGYDLDAAKASGLMESIESFHAERVDLPVRFASYEDLRYSHSVVDIEALPRLADSHLTPHTRMMWVEGQNLNDGRNYWVPYELVHLDYTLPLPSGHGCFSASSNGLASGNVLLEAISHGICEVVERDATTLWHLKSEAQQARTRIDLDSVEDHRCRALIERYADAGVELAVWDTTSDVGIPSFLCRILQKSGPPAHNYRPASGMGCHLSREIALLRALTEAAQSRLTFISGARDDMQRKGFEHYLDPATHQKWKAAFKPSGPLRSFSDVTTLRSTSLEGDVRHELSQLRSAGIEQVIIVDLTKPVFGIPVVRVIIPGLEGIGHAQRYVPGPRAKAVLAGVH